MASGEGVSRVMPLEILDSSALQGSPPRFCGNVGDRLTLKGERVTDAVSVLIVACRVLHLLKGLDAWLCLSGEPGQYLARLVLLSLPEYYV